MSKARKAKKPLHVTLSEPIADALEALAVLEGRSVSEILEESGRAVLNERGYLPKATGHEISEMVSEMSDAKKKRKKKGGDSSPKPQQ